MTGTRRPSPAVRARRALLVDLIAAAAFAAFALTLAAGLGVVAFVAIPVLLLGLLWVAAERLFAALGRRRGSAG
jgi:hypothetical protein